MGWVRWTAQLKKRLIQIRTKSQLYNAIRSMKVRGAPAIGVAAALGVAAWMKRFRAKNADAFFKELDRTMMYIKGARPTAVNLGWALERMKRSVDGTRD